MFCLRDLMTVKPLNSRLRKALPETTTFVANDRKLAVLEALRAIASSLTERCLQAELPFDVCQVVGELPC
jgi:hypothetical protein